MRSVKDFFAPLAAGAPAPFLEIPVRPARALHFIDPSSAKLVSKVPRIIGNVDVLVGNLEDGVHPDVKGAARTKLIEIANTTDFAQTQLWARINSLASPWALDDLTDLVSQAGQAIDVIMVPQVEDVDEIHYLDRLIAQLEARAGLQRPVLVHAILETARGIANVDAVCGASARLQGVSFAPVDLCADRRMRTAQPGGAAPDYVVRAGEPNREGNRPTHQQDIWHYTLSRVVDACAMHRVFPFFGPFGDISDNAACGDAFRSARAHGCVGAWSLHPRQAALANAIFGPSESDIVHARRVVAASGDRGAAWMDGKFYDYAAVRQCSATVELADRLAAGHPQFRDRSERRDTYPDGSPLP